ncbi:hypothetical protein SSX86_031923 [Deinandra increscens subsp. villosa]|uniref:J domain-containing protein n=1 Tax=Deinandra increscens subsp. villosa TaxID=3103831 RepID=A0AAP0GID3_9ASTR
MQLGGRGSTEELLSWAANSGNSKKETNCLSVIITAGLWNIWKARNVKEFEKVTMGASEENSGLFPIFILTMIALPLVPYTIMKLCRAASKKAKSINCQCAVCSRSGKYRKSIFKKVSKISTWSNLTLVLLWIIMGVLVYYIKNINREIQVFEPFNILGLQPGASDSEIKKAYRRLSVQYHPDKNPDPEAHKYFIESIAKAYQALTDPISRENFEKYGHPDGRQVGSQNWLGRGWSSVQHSISI